MNDNRTFKNEAQKTELTDKRKNGLRAGDVVRAHVSGRTANATVINTPDHEYVYNANAQFVGRTPACVEVDSEAYGYLYWKNSDQLATIEVKLDDEYFVLFPRDKADEQFKTIDRNTDKYGFNYSQREALKREVAEEEDLLKPQDYTCDFCEVVDRDDVLPYYVDNQTLHVCEACEDAYDAIVVHEDEVEVDVVVDDMTPDEYVAQLRALYADVLYCRQCGDEVGFNDYAELNERVACQACADVHERVRVLTPADDKYFASFAPRVDLTALYSVTFVKHDEQLQRGEPFALASHLNEQRGVEHAVTLDGYEVASLITWYVRNKVVYSLVEYKHRQGHTINADGFEDTTSRRFVELYVDRANAL